VVDQRPDRHIIRLRGADCIPINWKGEHKRMGDYNISIRVGRSGTRQGGGSPRHCEWPCPFCNGKGRDPAGIRGTELCRGCGGVGWWVANVDCDRLLPCGNCGGRGGYDSCGRLILCPVCLGHGKVK